MAKPCKLGGFVVLDDVTSVTLATALSALSQQQQVSANNLANMETPSFQASRVSFEDSLRSAVAAGDPAAAQISLVPTGDPSGVNGNNVSLNSEIVAEQKNNTQYQLLTTAISAKFDLITDAIKG
jgi:flagellar basal-body rod protein FlgB